MLLTLPTGWKTVSWCGLLVQDVSQNDPIAKKYVHDTEYERLCVQKAKPNGFLQASYGSFPSIDSEKAFEANQSKSWSLPVMLSNIREGTTVLYELQKGQEKLLCMGYKRVDDAILEAKQSAGRRDIPLMARDRK